MRFYCRATEKSLSQRFDVVHALRLLNRLQLTSFTMDFVETASVVALALREKSKRRKQKYWVHPLCNQRLIKGHFHTLHEELCAHPRKFFLDVTIAIFFQLLII